MRRFLTITKLKPDKVGRYIELHDQIGPSVVKAAHDYNLRNYSIHRVGLYLFSYFEYVGDDYESDMLAKNALPVAQKWRRQTGECFDRVTEQESALTAEEIFHHDF